MTWTVEYTSQAVKQLSKLDRSVRQRIYKFVDDRILSLDNPRSIGKVLQGSLSEYWAYRVGDYRLLVKIEDQRLIILFTDIAHRKDVYKS